MAFVSLPSTFRYVVREWLKDAQNVYSLAKEVQQQQNDLVGQRSADEKTSESGTAFVV